MEFPNLAMQFGYKFGLAILLLVFKSNLCEYFVYLVKVYNEENTDFYSFIIFYITEFRLNNKIMKVVFLIKIL